MDNKFKLWLNVKITERALAKQLEVMCKADKRTRSDFVRLLIAKEFNERVADQSQGIDTEKIKAQKQQKKSAALKLMSRQIEIRVVNVSYTPATSPEDVAMVRAGISLLLKIMRTAKQKDMESKGEVTSADLGDDADERNNLSHSANLITAHEQILQPEVTYAGVINHDSSTDSLAI